ncbi:hypothetical protein CY35_10G079000 [Sphagnum magellanicum]|jgi:hypothetical protein|nr:hypothetical protein CY35_10G079000 [Sphagnum magellanicum]KAH9550573.1 hypothetical protein CY35_10G079000 [Sphagnum magellanicum]KAH9550574.1 hypothetical protein CY35_10G079000 [Sphagnum magellanicum]KAH9550575.1 hypothetical protein CY35_10G079000 [Sphagnum magellanicum]KAH9550576.1 hypothetical protein CY35_10G079000 [Sphagnum magellanicum]
MLGVPLKLQLAVLMFTAVAILLYSTACTRCEPRSLLRDVLTVRGPALSTHLSHSIQLTKFPAISNPASSSSNNNNNRRPSSSFSRSASDGKIHAAEDTRKKKTKKSGDRNLFETHQQQQNNNMTRSSSDIKTAPKKKSQQQQQQRSPSQDPAPAKLRQGKIATQVELKLLAAKQAIENMLPESADPTLDASVYHDVAAFSKSYEMMKKVFRVFVYKDGEKPLVHMGPQTGIYASEGLFIKQMLASNTFVVQDPSKAHMFFMPYSVKNMEIDLYVPDSKIMLPITSFVKSYVDRIQSLYPFWNRTAGADHFFVSCHDWGPMTTRNHTELRENAVKVVCNAESSSEYFVLGKDVSLPQINLHYLVLPSNIGGAASHERPWLAFFAGQMHGRVRPQLIEQWKDDPDMRIYEVPPNNLTTKPSYIQQMKESKYCICAMGYEVNSPRIVESIYYDCVPVIIADNLVLPFSDVLNWSMFSVTVPEAKIKKLKTLLTSIPHHVYRSMQQRLESVRKHFIWHDEPEEYDIFHMILHSVWMSRLRQLDSSQKSLKQL